MTKAASDWQSRACATGHLSGDYGGGRNYCLDSNHVHVTLTSLKATAYMLLNSHQVHYQSHMRRLRLPPSLSITHATCHHCPSCGRAKHSIALAPPMIRPQQHSAAKQLSLLHMHVLLEDLCPAPMAGRSLEPSIIRAVPIKSCCDMAHTSLLDTTHRHTTPCSLHHCCPHRQHPGVLWLPSGTERLAVHAVSSD
jgi:hypothetical protein